MVETHLSLTTPVDCMFYLGLMCAFLLPTSSTGTRSYIEYNVVQAQKKTIYQSFKRLSKLVRITSTLENLNLMVNLNFFLLQKYGAAAIFFLYGNKNVPSAESLRGRRCLRTRTFILFGLIKV